MKKQRLIVYIILTITLFLMALGFWLGTMQDITDTTSRLIAIGRWGGIITTFAILLELLLMARLPLIENNFDVDEITNFHRLNGYLVLAAIATHVAFLTIGYSQLFETTLFSQFININTDFDDVLLASIGSILFFIVAGTSIKIARTKVRYELWYYVHLFAYLAVALTFLHQISSGADLSTQIWYRYYWIALYVAVFGIVGYYRFLRPILYMYIFKFKVHSVEQEAESIFSVYVSGNNISKFKYQPGQYATWRFLHNNYWAEAHPLSFSSTPGADILRITCKTLCGDYSKRLQNIPIGTKVMADGPRGAFLPKRLHKNNVLLVAGGVGIAPMISILPTVARSHKTVTILYSATKNSEFAFMKEFQSALSKFSNIRIILHETSNKGRLTQNHLKEVIGDEVDDTCCMLCGPNEMTDAIRMYLLKIGIPKQDIIAEQFKF